MSFDGPRLFGLLPAVLRLRDRSRAVLTPGWLDLGDRIALADLEAKVAAGIPLTAAETQQLAQLQQDGLAGPLASLLAVMAEQMAVLQEDLEQLYDDEFIETCADWVVPYIGDLIGYRMLHGVVPKVASPRAEVAHTIAYRRRKGTIVVLEQLARDVTGWNATAVEFFQRLVMTQYMNHLRRSCFAAPDLRRWESLEYVGTAFDAVNRTVDVRRIASRRGRYNIPNVGLFLWRLNAYPLSGSPAVPIDDRRWRFHPLGLDQPLYTRPQTENQITQLATPLNVPMPIGRRVLDAHLADYYSDADNVLKSLRVYEDSSGSFKPVDRATVRVCDLSDVGATWAHLPPAGQYAVDPTLGRIALPPGLPVGTRVRVDFHYAFSADMGGGEYPRPASPATSGPAPTLFQVPTATDPAITAFPTIKAALAALSGEGVIEITDSGRYEETLAINVNASKRIEVRAANRHRPTLVLGDDLTLSGGADSEVRFDGLLIAGKSLLVSAAAGNALRKIHINHCTLVPGLSLAPDCTPLSPDEASLTAELADLEIAIERSIVGSIRVHESATVSATDSIIDATATQKVAYAALNGTSAGAPLTLNACTVIGKLHALKLPLVSNSVLLANLADTDTWAAPVIAARRQEGCVRFSYVPPTARVPRRYHCLPEAAASPALALPRMTSLRYGFPGYAQLALSAGSALPTGADDEGQPGAFHHLYQPQRETNLRVRLDEYLRVGLEAGIFYES